MKPSFALNLSHDGISLLHRANAGWLAVGDVSLDAPDLMDELVALRRTAADLEAAAMTTKLVIPESQVLYVEVDAPGPSRSDRVAQIRDALVGMTPYDPQDLVFDWRPKGKKAQVAIVARETLTEAEGFATQYRFNPVSFVATPRAGEFDGEPFFGPTRHAIRYLDGGQTIEPDKRRIRVLGRLADTELPASALPAPRTAPSLVPTPPRGGSEAPVGGARMKSTAGKTLSTPAAASAGPLAPAGPVPLHVAAPLVAQTAVAMAAPEAAQPLAFASRRGGGAAALAVGSLDIQLATAVARVADLPPTPAPKLASLPREDAETVTLYAPADGGPHQAPLAPPQPADEAPEAADGATTDTPVPNLVESYPADAGSPVVESAAAEAEAPVARDGAPKLAATLARMKTGSADPADRPKPPVAPQATTQGTPGGTATGRRGSSRARTLPLPKVTIPPRSVPATTTPAAKTRKAEEPRPVTATEADAMTVFGARGKTPPTTERPRFLRPALTLVTLLALVAVALWSTYFLSDFARTWFGLGADPDIAELAEPAPLILPTGPAVVTDGPIAGIETPEALATEAPLVAAQPEAAPGVLALPAAPATETAVPPSVPLPGIEVTALQPETAGTPPAVPAAPVAEEASAAPATQGEEALPGVLVGEGAGTPPALEPGAPGEETAVAAADPAVVPEAPPAPIDIAPPAPLEVAPPAPLVAAAEPPAVEVARAGDSAANLTPGEPGAADDAAGAVDVAVATVNESTAAVEPDIAETAAIAPEAAEPEIVAAAAPAQPDPLDAGPGSDIATVAPRGLGGAPALSEEAGVPAALDVPGTVEIVRLVAPPVAENTPDAELTAPAALPLRTTVLTPEQAEALLAERGIFPLAPTPSAAPGIDRFRDTVLSTVDVALAEPRPRGLPTSEDYDLSPALPQATFPPLPLTQEFELDDRGLVRATEEGALTPQGAVVFRGLPAFVPPPRPEPAAEDDAALAPDAPPGTDAPEVPPETDLAAEAPDPAPPTGTVEDEFNLVDPAAFRDLSPLLDAGDLAEVEERARFGGLTLTELAEVRPALRPGDTVEVAEAAPPPVAVEVPATDAPAAPRPSELVAAAAAAALATDGAEPDAFVLAGAEVEAPPLRPGTTVERAAVLPRDETAPVGDASADLAAAPDASAADDAPAAAPETAAALESDTAVAPEDTGDAPPVVAEDTPSGDTAAPPADVAAAEAPADMAPEAAEEVADAEAETAGDASAADASLAGLDADAAPADPLIAFANVVPPLRPGTLVPDTAAPDTAAPEAEAEAVAEAEAAPETDAEPSATAEAEVPAFEDATEHAVAVSPLPPDRPNDFAEIVKAALSEAASDSPAVAAAAPPGPDAVSVRAPEIPTSATVASTATEENAMRLNRVNLIGVYGSANNRRALVRLSSGRYVKVQVGDTVDGGKVAAIGDDQLQYTKGGKTITLELPKG